MLLEIRGIERLSTPVPTREPIVRESIQDLPTDLRERVLAMERRGLRVESLLDVGRAFDDPRLAAWYLERLHKPVDTHPVLLLPLRLEARVDQLRGLLKVRVIPDAVAIDLHDPRLSARELAAGERFLAALADAELQVGDERETARRDAWHSLSTEFGPTRAAWIGRACAAGPTSRGSAPRAGPVVRCLPDRLRLYIATGSGPPLHFDGRLIPHTVALTGPGPTGLFDNAAAWVRDFDAAVEQGLGFQVALAELGGAARIETLVVVGLRRSTPSAGQQLVESLISAHHYSDGFALVEPGTSTNNLPGRPAGYSSREDHNAAGAREFDGPVGWQQSGGSYEPNAQRLGVALGLGKRPDVFEHIEGATSSDTWSLTAHLRAALWPTLGDYFLRTMMGHRDHDLLVRAHQHFAYFVSGDGPVPSVRVGVQPYGVLPIMPFADGWSPSLEDQIYPLVQDTRLDQAIHDLLMELHRAAWSESSGVRARIPRAGNSDDSESELVQLLSMQPVSASVTARPFVDDRLVSWTLGAMIEKTFGPGTDYESLDLEYWGERWRQQWLQMRQDVDDRLSVFDGLPAFLDQPMSKIFGWFEAQEVRALVARDPSQPLSYLRALAAGDLEPTPDTLLHELLLRSVYYNQAEDIRLWAEAAVTRLAESSLLVLFNRPRTGAELHAAVSELLASTSASFTLADANAIIEHRSQLATRHFTSPFDIRSTPGLDPSSLLAIAERLTERPLPFDIDRSFRQTLDLLTHRLDAWFTSLAVKRLHGMRRDHPEGVHLGAFGYLEQLEIAEPDAHSDGFIHTPSANQTAAATVAYNAYLAYRDSDAYRLNLTSERVRRALELNEGVRQGQTLGALLGCQFERALHQAQRERWIDDFRAAFPPSWMLLTPQPDDDTPIESIAARTVVDGLALARAWRAAHGRDGDSSPAAQDALTGVRASVPAAELAAIDSAIEGLSDALDAVSDVLLYESVYHAVAGNYEAASAATAASSGAARPPTIQSLTTEFPAARVEYRVALILPPPVSAPASAREAAAPRLAAWIASQLGDLAQIGYRYRFVAPTGRPPLDLNRASAAELARLPGLDRLVAAAIVDQRTRSKGFHRVTQLLGVRGFTPERLEGLWGHVTVGPDISVAELEITAIDLLYLAGSTIGEGGENELELRARRVARARDNLQPNYPVELDFASARDRSLADALELLATTLTLITSARPLAPGDLAEPSTAEVARHTVADVEEIHARASRALATARKLRTDLDRLAPSSPADPLLRRAAEFGIAGALRSSTSPATISRELGGRIDRATGLLPELPPDLAEDQRAPVVAGAVAALKALFGRAFVVVPRFVALQAGDISASRLDPELLGPEPARVKLRWLEQYAEVEPALTRLTDWMMMSSAWTGVPFDGDALEVAQLPRKSGERWLALSDAERNHQPRPDRALSIMALQLSAVAREQPIAGLLLANCSDSVPRSELTTSVAFHYNAPNSQAPQCLLLALPERREPIPQPWTEARLLRTVEAAIELAKVRAVDLDTISQGDNEQLSWYYPPLFLPGDPERLPWLNSPYLSLAFDRFLIDPDDYVDTGVLPGGLIDKLRGVMPGIEIEVDGLEVVATGPDPHVTTPALRASLSSLSLRFSQSVSRVTLVAGSDSRTSWPTVEALDAQGNQVRGVIITREQRLPSLQLDGGGTLHRFSFGVSGSGVHTIRVQVDVGNAFVQDIGFKAG